MKVEDRPKPRCEHRIWIDDYYGWSACQWNCCDRYVNHNNSANPERDSNGCQIYKGVKR